MDNLIECKKCGGNACYEQQVNEKHTTSLCMGCGFSTSTFLTEGSEQVDSALATSPELYKDLMYKDKDGFIWLPSTITMPEKGMVFIDGTSVKKWKWAAVQAVKISEEDRKLKNYPEDQSWRMDMKNVKLFEQKAFMDALEVIGFYEA
jgi:hypothetical protein|tara:strand:- start:425 stop:868 length:444 start_codon:yes stop_codon:yes gene_type:complete